MSSESTAKNPTIGDSARRQKLLQLLRHRNIPYPVSFVRKNPGGWMLWIGETPQRLGSNSRQAEETILAGTFDFLANPASKS